jgi:Domain of unknown function (DUF4329)
MSLEQIESTDRINRASDRNSSIFADSWNQKDIRALSVSKQEFSVPAVFGNFDLISMDHEIEAKTAIVPNSNIDAIPHSLSDISNVDANFKQLVREYFADQTKQCHLLAQEPNDQNAGEKTLAAPNPSNDDREIAQLKQSSEKEPNIPKVREPGHHYKTAEEAAEAALYDPHVKMISGTRPHKSTEYGGFVYENKDGSFSYTAPTAGTQSGEIGPENWAAAMDQLIALQKNNGQIIGIVGFYHTHPDSWDSGNEGFSPADRAIINGDPQNAFRDHGHPIRLRGYLRNYKGDIIERDPGDDHSTRIYHAANHSLV